MTNPYVAAATVSSGLARASFKTWRDEQTSFKEAASEACPADIEGDKVKAAYARVTTRGAEARTRTMFTDSSWGGLH
jgi:hypothetical protein